MALKHEKTSHRGTLVLAALLLTSLVALGVAVAAFIRARPGDGGPAERSAESSWQRAKRERTLRVGVGVVPPYTMVDLNQTDPERRYTGYCVDMVREIAGRMDPPWRVEWHQVNWSTLRAEMYSGKFDFVANIIYQTVPQAAEFDFTQPYSYVSVGLGVVRKGDKRFSTVWDLNRPDVTISLATGWTATQFAQRNLPDAKLLIKDIGDSTNLQFEDLMASRADIVLQDAPTVLNIAKNHPGRVDILWLDDPPMRVAAGFLLRKGDAEYREFLDVAIRALEADGTIRKLDQRWGGYGEYVKQTFVPGKGLEVPR